MKILKGAFTLILTALVITGCGGGGGGGYGNSYDINLSGSVGDGPIISATVTVKDSAGNIITTQSSDASANYSINTKAGSNVYPLTITATGGTDLVTGSQPDFVLYSVSLASNITSVNINPYTTLIYKIAEKKGGINQANVDSARTIVLNKLNFGLDAGFVPDPIKTRITDANVAHIIKASETFGEMIRRTRDLAVSAGNNMDADDIVNIIAADMVDGVLDGNGATGSNQQIAAFANISSAYVAIEAINNRLVVNGTDATQALDNAISTTKPGSTTFIADVAINARLIAQARNVVDAVYAVNPDSLVTNLKTRLQSVGANSYPASIAYIDTAALNNTLSMLSGASTGMLTNFNNASNGIILNAAPVISGTPAGSVTVNNTYSFTASASDANGDTLTFSVTNKPSWASFNTATGALTGTPTSAATFSNITIAVSDGNDSASLAAFSITVSPVPNTAPVISGSPATSVIAGNAYSFTPSASDADSDTLSFSITNKPAWASFSAVTGSLTGTPTAAAMFTNIMVTVSDGNDSVSLATFSIAVSPVPNTAPVISGSPATSVIAGNAYSFIPSASDADSDTLSFSITNKPAWVSFSTVTGALTGTPTVAATVSNITVTVSDGIDSTSLAAFSIAVSAAAAAPVAMYSYNADLSGALPLEGAQLNQTTAYFFFTNTTPYSAINFYCCKGLSGAATGEVNNPVVKDTSTPFVLTVNLSQYITIGTRELYVDAVRSDGSGLDKFYTNFTLNIVSTTPPPATGKAILSWTAPSTRTDASNLDLSEISGYRVYRGSSAGNLSLIADINNSTATGYTVSNLASGKYYFAITVYDTGNRESSYSVVQSKTIQ